jgi:uncharacterized protein (TIGR02284 family)
METTYPENLAKQLQRLLTVITDNRKVYLEANDKTENSEVKTMISDGIALRTAIREELREKVAAYGGNPDDDDDQGFLSFLQRSWHDLKASAAGPGNDQLVLQSCRNSDQVVLDTYDDTLQGSVLEDRQLKTFLADQRLRINEPFLQMEAKFFSMFKNNSF